MVSTVVGVVWVTTAGVEVVWTTGGIVGAVVVQSVTVTVTVTWPGTTKIVS